MIEKINNMEEVHLCEQLLRCCKSQRWAEQMLAHRPFTDEKQLLQCAQDVWENLVDTDWRQAFAGHPKIGDVDKLREKFATTAQWSEQEQAGVSQASERVLAELAAKNKEYEQKFGYIFIVCATGKSAPEMLEILCLRLKNDPRQEILIAAGEQDKITQIRLRKLLEASDE